MIAETATVVDIHPVGHRQPQPQALRDRARRSRTRLPLCRVQHSVEYLQVDDFAVPVSLFAAVVFVVLLASARAADPAGFKTLEIGDAAPDFRLPGVDGKDYSLSDFAKAKLLAIIFTCNHCPTAQAYEDRIIQLDAQYKDKGVALVAISPNDPLAVRLDELGYIPSGMTPAQMAKLMAEEKQRWTALISDAGIKAE